MTDYDYDLGIIGGGAAGLTIASGAAQLGAATLLIEKASALGGDCLHHGCVPSKTLIKTAEIRHAMQNASHWGLPEMQLPPVDMRQIASRIQSVIETIQAHDSEERFCSLGATVAFGEPRFLDAHTVEYGSGPVSAKRWAIATGSSPFIPSIPGLMDTPYWTNRDLFSLTSLPSSLTILGGGAVACEMAQAFARLGCHVTLIQRNAQILSHDDSDMADMVQNALSQDGIQFELNASLVEIRHDESGFKIDYHRNEKPHTHHSENLLVALGRTANIETLDLETAGVETSPKGITVDARMRTNVRHIFAAGDVTGRHQSTHAAGYEGGIVIANAIFHLPRKADYTWMPRCLYTQPELACIGMNEREAKQANIDYTVVKESFSSNDRALTEGLSEGTIKLLLDKRDKPLGVQICGPHAGELAAHWVTILTEGVKLSAVASATLPYPTLADTGKGLCSSILAKKLFSPKVRKALHFIFDYKGRTCSLDNQKEKA